MGEQTGEIERVLDRKVYASHFAKDKCQAENTSPLTKIRHFPCNARAGISPKFAPPDDAKGDRRAPAQPSLRPSGRNAEANTGRADPSPGFLSARRFALPCAAIAEWNWLA